MNINRILSFILPVIFILQLHPQLIFANEDYEKCKIPIISDKTNEVEYSGLKKNSTLYISLKDACKLTGSEIVQESVSSFTTSRYSVQLIGNLANGSANLIINDPSLANPVEYEFQLEMSYFEDQVWVDLFSYVNCFGAEIDILTKDSESNKYNNVEFTTFEGYYIIESGIPFDEVYYEFMDNSSLQFDWVDWGQETGAVLAKAYKAVINDYKNIYVQFYNDTYESSDIYYETLINILECRPGKFDGKSLLNDLEEAQEDSNQFVDNILFISKNFIKSSDDFTNLAKDYLLETFSQNGEIIETEVKYMMIINAVSEMNDIEASLLYSSLLDENIKDETEYNSKNAAEFASDYAEFMKVVSPVLLPIFSSIESSAAKFQKIFESYSALYDSADKLNAEIQNNYKILSNKYEEIIQNACRSVLNDITEKAVEAAAPPIANKILDLYDIALKNLKSDNMENIANATQSRYIQQTVLKNVKLDKSDTSYYSLLMAMQSSYYSYKCMSNIISNNSFAKSVIDGLGLAQKQVIIKQLESLITKGYNCNRNFYNSPTYDWQKKIIDDAEDQSIDSVPDYSITEDEVNYSWRINPAIEAEDIIVSDEWDVNAESAYDVCAIIQQDGKYGIIQYDGSYIAEPEYQNFFSDGVYEISVSNDANTDDIQQVVVIGGEELEVLKNEPWGRGNIEYKYIYENDNVYELAGVLTATLYEESKPVIVEQYASNVVGEYNNQNGGYSVDKDKINSSEVKYGIAKSGQLLVPCEYEDGCMSFSSGGITALKKNEKWGFFDEEGNQILDFNCETFSSKILYGRRWKDENSDA